MSYPYYYYEPETPSPTPACHVIEQRFGRDACVSDGIYAFIGPIPYGFILLFIVPWIVNITFWLIARCKNRKIHPPFGYLLFSLGQNFLIALIIFGIMRVAILGVDFSIAAVAV